MARLFVDWRDQSAGGDPERRFADLEVGIGQPQGECRPPVDVVEHGGCVEVTVDVPGVPSDALRVIYASGTLIIVGRKLPRRCAHDRVTFHLAERMFGRFVRRVSLTGAIDAGRGAASLVAGELRVVLPRIDDRRGHDIEIEIRGG